jgi:hypothetical protein
VRRVFLAGLLLMRQPAYSVFWSRLIGNAQVAEVIHNYPIRQLLL